MRQKRCQLVHVKLSAASIDVDLVVSALDVILCALSRRGRTMKLGTTLWYEWSVLQIVNGTFTATLAMKIATVLLLRQQSP